MSWIFANLPQWLWIAVAIGAVVAVHLTLGWKAAAGAAVGAALWIMHGRAYTKGREDNKRENDEYANDLINKSNDARIAAHKRDADPSQLRQDDGYRRD